MTTRLVESLYVEALLLADEARSYFADRGQADRRGLAPLDRVFFTCESLRVTTRLMHVTGWLLMRRDLHAGVAGPRLDVNPTRRLIAVNEPDDGFMATLPEAATALIDQSKDLYERVRRLDEGLNRTTGPASPARGLLDQLEQAF